MSNSDFDFLRELLHRRSGLALTAEKRYLVESRLSILCRRESIAGIDEVVRRLRAGRDETLAMHVIEAMTTNETLFFRDRTPFDLFKNVVLPELMAIRNSSQPIRIWSAACSTGQEAYSLAMILDEMAPQLGGRRFEILGTDISQEVVEKAKAGSYSQFEIQRGLPVQMLIKYFTQNGDQWRVTDKLKGAVKFQTFNLLDDPSRFGMFDVIFCRNVMIYFDMPTKAKVISALSGRLQPWGVVVLGAAETALGVSEALLADRANRGLYRLPSATAAADKPMRTALRA
ncbi:MAG: CheR family methyltransferase [Bosea sp. (in: a-proteobacteria)]